MLSPLLKELDERILSDPSLNAAFLQKLAVAQRELGLVFGDRPTCPFLRPHIIARSEYDQVAQAAEVIAAAVERLAHHALRDDALLAVLGLTEREVQMAQLDPGYASLCGTSRLDAYVSDDGFQFLEYNAESPAGVADQMQLERILFGLPQVEQLMNRWRHWRPEPHRRLLTVLLNTYREWGGESDHPNIAIVDWQGVSTESEFRIIQEYFAAEGYETIVTDPRELSYSGGHLRSGSFRIDIVYKRVIIHEFLERCDENHPLARAYADRRVCVVNSFRSKVGHKKAVFAILSDPAYAHLFTAAEIAMFRRHIPWTRCVENRETVFEDANHNLLDLIRLERRRFVLKPNDDYGGHGVSLGWETSADDWEQAIAVALERSYVVQERVAPRKIVIPAFDNGVHPAEMFVDFNPFLFNNEVEGALIRLSSSSLLNVTSGGGQTALLVLEDM